MKKDFSDVYQKATTFLPWNIEHYISNNIVNLLWTKSHLYYFQNKEVEKWFIRINLCSGRKDKLFKFSDITSRLYELNNQAENITSEVLTNLSVKEEGNTILDFYYKKNHWIYIIECKILQKGNVLENHSLSPDKKWALEVIENNLYIKNLLKKESCQITYDGEQYYNYATSPETNTCTVSDRINGNCLLPVAEWSPDSRKIITHKLDQRHVKDLFLLQNAPENGFRPILHKYKMSFAGDNILPLAQLQVIDIENKKVQSVKTDPLLSPYLTPIEFGWVWWSDDSEKIYFIRETRGSKEIILSSIDSHTGNVEELISEKADFTYVEPSPFAPWSRQVIILKQQNKIIWLSERDSFAHLYIFDLKDKKLKVQITKGEWFVKKVYFYDDQDDWLYFTACGYYKDRDPYFEQFFRCRLNGEEINCLSPEEGCHDIEISPCKTCYVDTYSTINTAPISYLKKMNGEIICHLETTDISRLSQLNWAPPQRFCLKARDGKTDIYGNIYFPSNFNKNHKYPLIDHIYPGPQIFRTPTKFNLYATRSQSAWFAQALAELGFIVIHVDGFGTPGRAKNFHDYTYENMGDCGLQDHVVAIKQLSEQYSFIDQEKIGITGYSAGGYAAARAVLLHSNMFKVAVSIAGNHELRAYPASYGEKYNGLDINTYQNQSNAEYAKNLNGKLLLIHGELDDNVHPCSTLQLVNALIENNKDFDFIYMPNQNHQTTFYHPYTMRKTWDYLVEHLLEIKPSNAYTFPKYISNSPRLIDWGI